MANVNSFLQDFETMLSRGAVHFKLKKKDGTTREVFATTNLRYIPSNQHPKGNGPVQQGVVKYYDLEDKGWKSMQSDTDFITERFYKTLPKRFKQ